MGTRSAFGSRARLQLMSGVKPKKVKPKKTKTFLQKLELKRKHLKLNLERLLDTVPIPARKQLWHDTVQWTKHEVEQKDAEIHTLKVLEKQLKAKKLKKPEWMKKPMKGAVKRAMKRAMKIRRPMRSS